MKSLWKIAMLAGVCGLSSCASVLPWRSGAHEPLSMRAQPGSSTAHAIGDPVETLSAAYAQRHAQAPVYGHTIDPLHETNAARGVTLGDRMAGVANAHYADAMMATSAAHTGSAHTGTGTGAQGDGEAHDQGSGQGSGLYAIHLASYYRIADARAGWALLSSHTNGALNGLTPRVEHADLGAKGRFERLKAGPFYSRADADARCDALKAAGFYCQITDFAGANL